MTYDECVTLLAPVLQRLYNSQTIGVARHLEREIGRDKDPNGYTLGYCESSRMLPIDESYRQELIALAGPHGKTVLKVLKVRKGIA